MNFDTIEEAREENGRIMSIADDDSELEAPQPPPQKRTRNAASSNRPPARKKQVRGKQGRLAGLMNTPIDIFTEIASHLMPVDIISLARTNKSFRSMLMHKSSIHIWHRSIENVTDIPRCPPDMSEPHYLALLFSKTCSNCGKPARGRMDALLRVKLCGQCRNECLISMDQVAPELQDIVHYSSNIAPPGVRQPNNNLYVLREEIPGLCSEYDKKKTSGTSILEAWIEEKINEVNQRQKESHALIQFLDNIDEDREKELGDVREARRVEIERRVKEMGWAEEDIPSDWRCEHHNAWKALINQPKPLTERIWANTKPKLIAMLEASRVERLEKKREQAILDRQTPLRELLAGIQKKIPPAFTLKRNRTRGSSDTFSFSDIFPSVAHSLGWPIVNELLEADLTSEELAIKLEERRQEIETLVHEWRTSVRAHFVHQVKAGGTNMNQALTFNTHVPHMVANCDSDDLKRLFRADSLFHSSSVPESQKVPLTYESIIREEKLLVWWPYPSSDDCYPKSLKLEHIHWYPEAHETAKALLSSLEKPDACCLEIRAYSETHVYMCGRCHDTTRKSWEGMIQHYIEQKQKHTDIRKDLESLANQGFVYVHNDVHDLALETDLPLIKKYTKPRRAKGEEAHVKTLNQLRVCKVCEKILSAGGVVIPQSSMLQHLLHVHGIDNPEPDEHYAPKN